METSKQTDMTTTKFISEPYLKSLVLKAKPDLDLNSKEGEAFWSMFINRVDSYLEGLVLYKCRFAVGIVWEIRPPMVYAVTLIKEGLERDFQSSKPLTL